MFGGLDGEKDQLCREGNKCEFFTENLVGVAFPYGFKNSNEINGDNTLENSWGNSQEDEEGEV